MAIVDVDNRPVPLFPPGLGRPVLLWNLSLTRTAYISPARPVTPDSDSIPPLGSVTVDGEEQLFASSLDPLALIPVQVTPGGLSAMASPAQAADQLSLLGLMKDTTGSAINTTLGAPGQDTTLQTIHTTLGIPSQDTTLAAIPAALQPALSSASLVRQGTTAGALVHTFAAASRLWALHLSFACATDASYTPALANVYAELKTGSGLALTLVELAVSDVKQAINGDSDQGYFNPIPVAAGNTLLLDVNNGAGVLGATLRASCSILYSSP